MTALVMTKRDMELLAFVAEHRSVPTALLAERFFKSNPFTGALSKSPLKACERRLSALRAHGHVEIDRIRDGDTTRALVRVAHSADAPLDDRASRRSIRVRERAHHLRTLDALAELERSLKHRGGRVVKVTLEAGVRTEQQRGRKTRRGDFFEAFPDAVCRVALSAGGGGERVIDVAVEYVTSKYTDRDIREKHDSFRRVYGESFWFADRPRTAWRVKHITGGACSILS